MYMIVMLTAMPASMSKHVQLETMLTSTPCEGHTELSDREGETIR